MSKHIQLDMTDLLYAYGEKGGEMNNGDLYDYAARKAGMGREEFLEKEPVGQDGRRYSIAARKVRWMQQELKRLGLLERAGERGRWRLTREGRKRVELHASTGITMLGFSTKYGLAIWGDAKKVFSRIGEPITLVVTSPPYPIAKGRAYGKWDESESVDFILGVLEPIVKNLVRGGSIMLNVGSEVFLPGLPARSMWIERLALRLHDDLGLYLCDRLIWQNPQRPPSPTQWACKERVQLASQYEFVLWMSSDPSALKTDNRRVLRPLSERTKKLIAQGGEKREREFGDGAYRIKKGSFGNEVQGSIERNVLRFSHTSKANSEYRKKAKERGLPVHGAMFPYELAEFLVRFGSEEGDLVADPFGGAMTTALAAHKNKRRFVTTELMGEYVAGGALRFGDDASINPELASMFLRRPAATV